MDFIFLKSKKEGCEEFGTIYARVRTDGYNRKYTTGFTIREIEWQNFLTLQYASYKIIRSVGIKYGQFASVLAQIKAALEDNFDPETAPAIIRSVKSTVLNGEKLYVKEPKKSMLLVDYFNKYTKVSHTHPR